VFEISNTLSINDVNTIDSNLQVTLTGEKTYNISLITAQQGKAKISIYDISGKVLAQNFLKKEADRYNYELNMAYASSGLYLIKMETKQGSAIKKITVK